MYDHPTQPAPADPPAPPSAPPPARGRRTLIAVVAALVVVLGGGAAGAFFLMRGASEELLEMVPAEADAFVTAYLDPSAGQKMNLLSLTDKFPDLGNRAKLSSSVDDMIDEALAESGTELTHQDIRPWLGSQLGAWFELGTTAPRMWR